MRAALLLLILAAGASMAAERRPAAPHAFVPSADGTLRINTGSGEVALCSAAAGTLSCRPLARAGGEKLMRLRLRDLDVRIAALEKRAAERSRAGDVALSRVARITEVAMNRLGAMFDREPHAPGGR